MSSETVAGGAASTGQALKRNFVFLLIGLQVLFAMVVIVGTVQHVRVMRDNALNERLIHTTRSVQGVEEHFTQTIYLVALTLANLEELSGYQPGQAAGVTQTRLEQIQRQMPVLRSLSLADRQGRIVVSSLAANVGRQLDLGDFLPQAPVERTGLLRLGAPWEGRDFADGRPVLPARPADPRNTVFFPLAMALPGNSGLVAVATVNSDFFLNRIVGNFDRDLLRVSIFDYNGTLLLSNEDGLAPGSRAVSPTLLGRIKQEEIGQQRTAQMPGGEAVLAYRVSRNYPLFVIGYEEHERVLGQWRTDTVMTSAVAGLALLATLLITGVLTQRLLATLSREHRLHEAQRKLHAAVEQSPSSIVITDIDAIIEYVNPEFTRATGYAPAEAMGKNPKFLQSKLTPPETFRALWERLSAGEVWEGEFINRRKDGSIYHANVNLAPIRDGSGRVTHYLAIQDDITARKVAEAALIEAKDAAESANRAKSAFLAKMSHELRTPMNGVMGMIEMARRRMADPKGLEQLGKAKRAADHLLDVINDILDLSKIQADRMLLEQVPIRLGDIVESMLGTLDQTARTKGLQLTTDLPVELMQLPLSGDPLRLTQILLNLVGNAIKFTERGEVILRIRAVAEMPEAVRIRFEVSDTGIGIDAEAQTRLFQAFEQGDNSMTRKYGGSGLGLAISKQLVQVMGGEIGVESTPGKGSTFWFVVLLTKIEKMAVAPTSSAAAKTAEC